MQVRALFYANQSQINANQSIIFFLIFIANANQSIIKNQNQCKPGFILNFRAKTLCKSKHYFQIKAKVKANQNFMFSLGVITKINAKTNQWDSREFQFQSQINASQGILITDRAFRATSEQEGNLKAKQSEKTTCS